MTSNGVSVPGCKLTPTVRRRAALEPSANGSAVSNE